MIVIDMNGNEKYFKPMSSLAGRKIREVVLEYKDTNSVEKREWIKTTVCGRLSPEDRKFATLEESNKNSEIYETIVLKEHLIIYKNLIEKWVKLDSDVTLDKKNALDSINRYLGNEN